jgi:hypothetical protein
MPLDPSIILGAKSPQFDLSQFSQTNALTNAMKFRQADEASQLNALKMAEYERTRTEEQDFRNYLATTEKPNDPANRANFLRYGKTGAAYGEALDKRDTAALTQQETQFKVEKAKREFTAQAFRDTSRNPSDANITAYKEDYLANPLFNKAEKDRMVAGVDRILTMPVGERAAFMSSQGASASELKPTLTPQTLGATTRLISTPAFGGAATQVVGSEGAVTATPAQLETNRIAQARLAFDKNKFAWEQSNPGYELKEGEDGTVMAINKRTLQAVPVTVGGAAPAASGVPAAVPAAAGAGMPSARVPAAATPAPMAGGTPLRGKSPAMTETQSNAAMFGGAMMQAQNTIDQLEKTGTVKNAVVPGLLTGLVNMAPFGSGQGVSEAIGSAFNADPTGLIGPNAAQQKLAQAQLAFATAYLRKTSGAAFGASEIANTIKEYFPLQGEGAAIIQQKAAARKRAVEGMKISTNAEGKKYINTFSDGGAPAAGVDTSNPLLRR